MHFEQFGFSLHVPGKDTPSSNSIKKEFLAPDKITKFDMIRWIKRAAIDVETKDELLKMIAKYPANTMHHFYKNIHKHIQRIHSKRESKESPE